MNSLDAFFRAFPVFIAFDNISVETHCHQNLQNIAHLS